MATTPFIGQVQAFSFNFAPKGWSMCQGQILPINNYQALFALLGTMYGGNGTSTFALPNLQSRAVRGYGQGNGLSTCTMGMVTGVENVTLLTTNLPSHNHTLVPGTSHPHKASSQPASSPDPGAGANVLSVLNDPGLTAVNSFYTNSAPNVVLNIGSPALGLGVSGANSPVNIMQPYLAINYCIAMTGIFPSRN